MRKLNQVFDARKEYGIIFLRLIIGWKLIAGTWPLVSQSKPISEVTAFFTQLGLPAPEASAYLSVYAQFICGVLFILGLFTRPAALVMIINFIVAIVAAHLQDSIDKSFNAWVILGASLLFLFTGAGKLSVDGMLNRRREI